MSDRPREAAGSRAVAGASQRTPFAPTVSAAAVRRAIESGQPEMVFQPVVDLVDGRLIGLEALARFQLEPFAPPDLWFGTAHRAGMGVELELAVVRRALEAVSSLPPEVYLAINVSPITMLGGGVEPILAQTTTSQIVLEITEHARVESYPELNESLTRIRGLGVRIAVDDVGAGFASLSHVLNLDPEIIKLDRELTRDLDTDPDRAKLAGGLIAGASAVSILVVAEGIETREQLDRLLELGARGGQGYFIGPPAELHTAIASPRVHDGSWTHPATPPPEDPKPRSALSRARVLVVDDCAAHRHLIRSVFEVEGAAVHEAATVSEATESLGHLLPDLILVDMRLPDGTGFEVLEHARRTGNVPVFFLTAASAETDHVAGLDLGADDYVLKPFSPRVLVARADAALRRRRRP